MTHNPTNNRIEHILSFSPAIIYTCRAEGDFGVTFISENFTPRFGYSVQECLDNPDFWRKPEDRDRMVAAIKEYGFIDNLGSSFYGKDGKTMTCIVSSRAIEYEGEVRMLSIVIDVTEQRKAEEALRKLDQAEDLNHRVGNLLDVGRIQVGKSLGILPRTIRSQFKP